MDHMPDSLLQNMWKDEFGTQPEQCYTISDSMLDSRGNR